MSTVEGAPSHSRTPPRAATARACSARRATVGCLLPLTGACGPGSGAQSASSASGVMWQSVPCTTVFKSGGSCGRQKGERAWPALRSSDILTPSARGTSGGGEGSKQRVVASDLADRYHRAWLGGLSLTTHALAPWRAHLYTTHTHLSRVLSPRELTLRRERRAALRAEGAASVARTAATVQG